MTAARAFAPASVSNVTCGFDILGFGIESLGDIVRAETTEEPGIVIAEIRGARGRLPRDPQLNTASIAAQAVLDRLGVKDRGLVLEIDKHMPLSSGLGSSAASSVAGAVAADAALQGELSSDELLLCAIEGERAASGSVHADNVAPSLYGSLVLVRSAVPPDIIELPVPGELSCGLLRPRIEVRTHEARILLGDTLPLQQAVTQWANIAGLIAALYRADWELLERCLVDVVAEPVRAPIVPGFAAVKAAALEAGALGCSLSGSGPAIFALCRDRAGATAAALAMHETFQRKVGIESEHYATAVGTRGAHVLADSELPPVPCVS